MKKLLAIVVLGLLWSSNIYANNLVGKQLECTNKSSSNAAEYYVFKNNREIEVLYIDKKSLKVGKHEYNYKVFPRNIDLYWGDVKLGSIDRKSLRMSDGSACKVVNFNVKNYLEKQSKNLIEAISKDNKI